MFIISKHRFTGERNKKNSLSLFLFLCRDSLFELEKRRIRSRKTFSRRAEKWEFSFSRCSFKRNRTFLQAATNSDGKKNVGFFFLLKNIRLLRWKEESFLLLGFFFPCPIDVIVHFDENRTNFLFFSFLFFRLSFLKKEREREKRDFHQRCFIWMYSRILLVD